MRGVSPCWDMGATFLRFSVTVFADVAVTGAMLAYMFGPHRSGYEPRELLPQDLWIVLAAVILSGIASFLAYWFPWARLASRSGTKSAVASGLFGILFGVAAGVGGISLYVFGRWGFLFWFAVGSYVCAQGWLCLGPQPPTRTTR